jgi:hypothetical protein
MRDWFSGVASVLIALPRIEFARRRQGPGPLVKRLRREGRRRKPRTADERERLQYLIARIDALLPGGGNCYRRALLEIALDREAAAEPFSMGLTADCRPMSGHAWLGSAAPNGAHYDAIIAL